METVLEQTKKLDRIANALERIAVVMERQFKPTEQPSGNRQTEQPSGMDKFRRKK